MNFQALKSGVRMIRWDYFYPTLIHIEIHCYLYVYLYMYFYWVLIWCNEGEESHPTGILSLVILGRTDLCRWKYLLLDHNPNMIDCKGMELHLYPCGLLHMPPVPVNFHSPADVSHGSTLRTTLWGPPGATPITGEVGDRNVWLGPTCVQNLNCIR